MPVRPLTAVPTPTLPPQQGVRRLSAPATEPPYDSERAGHAAGEVATVAAPTLRGSLALETAGSASSAGAPPALRLVTGSSRVDDRTEAPPTTLPDPRPWAGRIAQAAMEALAGDRPLAQLVRWTSEEVYRQLGRRLAGLAQQDTATRRSSARTGVRSVHVCTLTPGVVEATVIVTDGPRCRALALRMETVAGRWQCTALEM